MLPDAALAVIPDAAPALLAGAPALLAGAPALLTGAPDLLADVAAALLTDAAPGRP